MHMHHRNHVFCTAALAIGLGGTATADTLHVPADFATVQDAINAATDGDTVSIAGGTWFETGIDPGGKLIVISGATDASGHPLTVLDGQGSGPILKAVSGEGNSMHFENLVLTNGAAQRGAGLYIDQASPTISNCWFNDNSATDAGAAASIKQGAAPQFINCQFNGNNGLSSGGAVYVENAMSTFNECLFANNESGYAGGALYGFHADVTIVDSNFENNSVPQRGAAVAAFEGSMFISGSMFSANVSDYDGGAVYVHTVNLIVNSSSFNGNQAINGGALNTYQGTASIANCLFENNAASLHAGAVFHRYSSGASMSDCEFIGNSAPQGGAVANIDTVGAFNGCTFSLNAGSLGGAMYIFHSTIEVTNSLIMENTADDRGGAVMSILSAGPSMSDSMVCGNVPDQLHGSWTDVGGNTVADECDFDDGVHACCVLTGCAELTADVCEQLGGLWLADDQTCDDCPDYCVADVNGDGLADVADILVVIAAWGPCL